MLSGHGMAPICAGVGCARATFLVSVANSSINRPLHWNNQSGARYAPASGIQQRVCTGGVCYYLSVNNCFWYLPAHAAVRRQVPFCELRRRRWKLRENGTDLAPDEKETKKATALASVMELFVGQIDGLADTFPLAAVAIKELADSSRKQMTDFVETKLRPALNADDKTRRWIADPAAISTIRRLSNRAQRSLQAAELVPRSLLVSLVSQFDAFIGALVRALFKTRPDVLNSSSNTLTFSQLASFRSLSDAREYIVDKEVDSLLRKSHAEQFDWLENKFGLPLRKDLPAWQTFIEITERRNLFVHANGIVSQQYLEVCGKNGCKLESGARFGESLSVSRAYFEAAHECIFEIGIKLAQVLWRKLSPEGIAEADLNLINVCYELLFEGRFRLAKILSDFAAEALKKHSSENARLTMVVNRAQAYKWLGDNDAAQKIISEEDWTAASLRFRLAQAVLLDNFSAVYDTMRKIGTG